MVLNDSLVKVRDYSKMVVVYRKSSKVYDPTRTTALRDAFAAQMQKRFNELKRAIKEAIVDQDCFGLVDKPQGLQFNALGLPGHQAFKFNTKEQKVAAFMDWLREQEAKGLLQTTTFQQIGSASREPWTNMYIADAYKRGVTRARYEMGRLGMAVPGIDNTGGVAASMSTPFHMDRVGMLYTRTFEDLKGITAQMDSQISRILAQGMVEGDGPKAIAKKLIDTIGGGLTPRDAQGRATMSAERRAKILARTEIIRAHHSATIQEYRNWGVEGVGVEAEFRTAGDLRVCDQCSSLEGKVFSLDEAEGIIPVHPGCRCITIPTMPGEPIKERPVEDPYSLIVSKESEIRNNPDFETGIVFNRYGEEVRRLAGESRSISMPNSENQELKDLIFTHNHPTGAKYPIGSMRRIGNSFSVEDITQASAQNMLEIRAVTPEFTFIMKRPKGGWPTTQTIKQSYSKFNTKVLNENMHRLDNNITTISKCEVTHYHTVWKRVSKELGLLYSKIRIR